MQMLDTVVWERRDRRPSQRHLIGYTGLAPTYAGMRTVCGCAVPTERLLPPDRATAVDVDLCAGCRERLERRGRDYYERQQRRFTDIDRRRCGAEQHEEST